MSSDDKRATAVPERHVFTRDDVHLFHEGTHTRLYDKLGAHPATVDGVQGTRFAVWAPNAEAVSVVGDFNRWKSAANPIDPLPDSGLWQGFVEGVGSGAHYKYHVRSRWKAYRSDRADPFAFYAELSPDTASVVWELDYAWNDAAWMAGRSKVNRLAAPISIYEVHLGSWMRPASDPKRMLGYRELAPLLARYVGEQGFTHVELLPVMEHPYYGSWGYQTTGYFAPTSRFGTPQDFMFLVDTLHQAGIGVLLDWVPSHFATDGHGLAFFDGTHLYEHANPQQGFHPDWGSYIFNYGRNEVRSFLLSSALFWLDAYHADGIRVDAVASMLYLDYSRKAGEWVANKYGGRENLEAIAFLRRLNEDVYREHPDTIPIAEESTSWPMVTSPTWLGGLGFGLKWDMGWMHDTLRYMSTDPLYRKFSHSLLTFRLLYAFHENFLLPLSHDEVVHGKRSLLDKMPGDPWRKFANLRLLFATMFAQPGKKLLFMGNEIAQGREWSHEAGLSWELLERPMHAGIQHWVRDLNRLYRAEPALHELDCKPEGFRWIDCNDADASVVSLLRTSVSSRRVVLVVCNYTPIVRGDYIVGAPFAGFWREALNGDSDAYGGSGVGNAGGVEAELSPAHGLPCSLRLTLPPLAALFLIGEREDVVPTDGEDVPYVT